MIIFPIVKSLRSSSDVRRDFPKIEMALHANTERALIVQDHTAKQLVDHHYRINVGENVLVHTQIGARFDRKLWTQNKADVWMRTKVIDVQTGAAACIDENIEDGSMLYTEQMLNPHGLDQSRKIFVDLKHRPRTKEAQRIPVAEFICKPA